MVQLTDRVVLRDGGVLTIRPLVAADAEDYRRGVEQGMSAHSRYLRFASPKPRLSRREVAYLTAVDGLRHVAIVAIDESGRGVGVARYVTDGQGGAEFAIGVADAWQGRGVGRVLLARTMGHAREHGVRVMRATTLAENRAAIAMLRGAGFVQAGASGAQLEYERVLSAPGARPAAR